jgi:hypothetical protein
VKGTVIETGIEIASETETGKGIEIEMDGAEGKADLRREEDNTPLAGNGKEEREKEKEEEKRGPALPAVIFWFIGELPSASYFDGEYQSARAELGDD